MGEPNGFFRERKLLKTDIFHFTYYRKLLNSLYRKSARKMMHLKKYTPNDLIDKLIQYDYKNLHSEFREVAQDKMAGRQDCSLDDPILRGKVDFKYKKIDLSDVPLTWVKVWNMVYYPQSIQQRLLVQRRIHEELGIVNIKNFMNRFLVSYTKQLDSILLDKIHNIILSTL